MARLLLPLTHLSICPCGFGVLYDDIQLGTEYMVDMATLTTGLYRCGGCGAVQIGIPVIKASSTRKPGAPLCPIPWGLFADAPVIAQVQ